MEDYVIKYASSAGLSVLFTQVKGPSDSTIEFIDPMSAVIKLSLLCYKDCGTKLSIKNNKIDIQEPSVYQGFQRWFNSDERNQLYQLKVPLFYFRGLTLGYIRPQHLEVDQDMYFLINDLAIKGLKKMKVTYECKTGSLVKNCLDDYIKILSCSYTQKEYDQDLEKMNKPTMIAIYNEYIKLWFTYDFNILKDLYVLLEHETNLFIQNKLADSINCYVMAKDLKIDSIRPD